MSNLKVGDFVWVNDSSYARNKGIVGTKAKVVQLLGYESRVRILITTPNTRNTNKFFSLYEDEVTLHTSVPEATGEETDETSVEAIERVCNEIKDLLITKNRKYGDSALNPVRVLSKSDPIEQIKVRIDDKLSRIAQSEDDEDEDVIDDLIGYFILLKIAKGMSTPEITSDEPKIGDTVRLENWPKDVSYKLAEIGETGYGLEFQDQIIYYPKVNKHGYKWINED